MSHLILGDCLEVMKDIPDKSIDLVLTDPPYGIGYDKKVSSAPKKKAGDELAFRKSYGNTNWDDKIPEKKVFDEILRVSKHQIIFGGNYFINYLHNTSCFIVWDKVNGENAYADCEMAWTNFKTATRKITYRWHGMLQQNMKEKETRYHPTQKPVDLFAIILEMYAKKEWSILDPFAGSGTTGLACHRLGIEDYTLIEKEPKYYEIAKQRIEQAESQLHLF